MKEGIKERKNEVSSSKNISSGGLISQMLMQTPLMQRKLEEHKAIFGDKIVQKQENKTGIPDNLKSGMESLSGMSLDHVKVNYNSSKPKAVQAHAFAQGNEIHLASGQEKHLAHELGHVVQQAQGRVQPTTTVGGVAVNDNPALESEATKMGERALQRKNNSIKQLKLNNKQNILQGFFTYRKNILSNNDINTVDLWLNSHRFKTDFMTKASSKNDEGSISSYLKKINSKLSLKKITESSAILDDFLSDSDSEFEGIDSVKIDGLKKIDKTKHISNNATRFTKATINELENDANKIYIAGGGYSATTIVCGQFLTSDGDYLRVATSNCELMSPKERAEAESLGYVVFKGTKTHAEANLLTYQEKHSDSLKFEGHGCHRGACKQCEILMDKKYDTVDYGSKAPTGKFTENYYSEGISKLTSPKVDWMTTKISENY